MTGPSTVNQGLGRLSVAIVMYLFLFFPYALVILPVGRWQLRRVSGVVVRQATMHWYAN